MKGGGKLKGRFIITRNLYGEYTFELRAGNGEAIAISQTFPTAESCENIIDSIKRNAKAAVEDRTVYKWKAIPYPKFEVYKDMTGEFHFRLKSANGEIIAVSESYTTKSSCLKGIRSIGKNAPEGEIVIRNEIESGD